MSQSLFPGMDPYLEAPGLWPDVHERLMSIYAEQIAPLLAPDYVAELHTRIVIERLVDDPPQPRIVMPDVTVTQPVLKETAVAYDLPFTDTRYRLTVPLPAPVRLVTLHILHRASDRLITVIE